MTKKERLKKIKKSTVFYGVYDKSWNNSKNKLGIKQEQMIPFIHKPPASKKKK